MSDIPIPREALLSLREVMRLTTLGQSAIYARMNEGTFPASRQVGLRKVAWPAGEVLDWIAALPKRTPGGRPAVSSKGDMFSNPGDAAAQQAAIPRPSPRGRSRRTTAA